MIKRKTRKLHLPSLLFILSLFFLTVLCGCGSGPDSSGSSPSGTATLTVSVSSNTVTYGTPVTVTASLGVANTVVTFATTSNIVVFSQTTALTNSSGVATVNLNAASLDSAGAASITAAATVTSGGKTTTVTSESVGVAVNSAAVTIQELTLKDKTISAYASTTVSALVWLNGAPTTESISVTFSSSCGSKATLDTPVKTINGTATSTYKDNNCNSGFDDITASVSGSSKSVRITVDRSATNSIASVSVTPSVINLRGTGGTQSSVVKFKVVDNNGNGKAGVLVDFSLDPISAPGGITLSPLSATSDSNGEVTTAVTSGTVPTPVRVVASVNGSDPLIKTQSDKLTIITGVPTQKFLSLSVQTYNIEGWNYDGVTSTVTIIASDRLGTPVPDGTVINFISEGAQITPTCTTAGGTCTVTFKSAESRPTNGRVTILAYTPGEKSFEATSPNNVYTTGDTFYDLGDPYIDANENGQWDTGETFIVSDTAGSSACLTRPSGAPLPYGWDVPNKQNTCTAVWGNNYVRRSAVMVLSGSVATIAPATIAMGGACRRNFSFIMTDVNNNPMPANTAVSVGSNYVYFTAAGSTTTSKATITVDAGSPVGSTNAAGGTAFNVTIDGPDCGVQPAGELYLKVTTPRAITSSIPITVN